MKIIDVLASDENLPVFLMFQLVGSTKVAPSSYQLLSLFNLPVFLMFQLVGSMQVAPTSYQLLSLFTNCCCH
jgi:hypothetical protein